MTEKDFFKVNKFNLDKIKYIKISLEIQIEKSFFLKLKGIMIKTIKYFLQSFIIYILFI